MKSLGRNIRRVGAAAAAVMTVVTAAEAADTVKIDSGVLEGTVGTDPSSHSHDGSRLRVRVFKGVPFAAPPVGDARWKEPQPVAAWAGVRKADEWGTRCMQGPMFGPLHTRDTQMGEDCLYLNVWTTAKSAKARSDEMIANVASKMLARRLLLFHSRIVAGVSRTSRAGCSTTLM